MKTFSYLFFLFALFAAQVSVAQRPFGRLPGVGSLPSMRGGGVNSNRGNGDSSLREGVERRDYSDDSLVVKVYTLNAVRPTTFDTSIRDYTSRFPIQGTAVYLGNEGSATRSLLFSRPSRIGWDPGFHVHDAYKLSLDNVRFYNTPKPYTELGYMVATGSEQMIEVTHTQNIKPYWNASFIYRLLTAPGIFRNQRNNHGNIQITSWYQSPNKRYNNYFVFLQNSINAGESGGIVLDKDYLSDPTYERRFTIPTYLGGSPSQAGGAFNNNFNTGWREKENNVYMRQQYDFGRKDSIVTDSTVVPLFYPRVRFEHSFRYASYNYSYKDIPTSATGNSPDSLGRTYYDSLYNIQLKTGDSVVLRDRWHEVSNDFSIYQFPDEKNLQQFIKVGAELQLLHGYFASGDKSYYNFIGHGEYRNRTRNQKWDLLALGRLHFIGSNSGDYHAYVSLQRSLGQELGTLQIGGENINRSPSFIYNRQSSFYLDTTQNEYGKENTLHLFANYTLPKLALQLRGDYYVVTNYLYLKGYSTLAQENALFNVLRVSGLKTFRLNRRWNVYSELYLQQKAGSAQVNYPLFFTRNRLSYEGRFFRNLNLSTGVEVRYNSPYKADMYSPVLGQFFYQDTTTISNRPQVDVYFHMRVRTFKAYIRFENLNAASFAGGKNNLAAIGYPTPSTIFRIGIYWVFVN